MSRKLMPTTWGTEELRTLSTDVRKMSLFSARTISLDYLGEMQGVVKDMLSGKINEATGRQRLQTVQDELGYTPEKGYGMNEAPPAAPGSLRDLSSDRRVKLVIQTNTRIAANTAFMAAGQSDAALYQYPCWELVRIYPRSVPRGMKQTKAGIEEDPENSWPARFEAAGGELIDGRMIAPKDSEVWSRLGDSELFPDGTDSDAPPYAFGSGMGLRGVPRAECIALNVIDGDETPAPQTPSLGGNVLIDKTNSTLADLKATREELLAIARETMGGV